jgi:large subunit ribosomal protein L28
MAKTCDSCGKGVTFGNMYARRGMAKYLGGVGVKVTGVARRKFLPNLQRLHITDEGGAHKIARICTRCIKSGLVTKRQRREIPEDVLKKMRERQQGLTPEARRAARLARKQARKAAAAQAPKKQQPPKGQQPPPAPPKKK